MNSEKVFNFIKKFNKRFIISAGIMSVLFTNIMFIGVCFLAILMGGNPFLMIFFSMILGVEMVFFISTGVRELTNK